MQLPAPNPQALFTELDDGTGVLLHLDTKFYFTLNPTAVIVWKELSKSPNAPMPTVEHIAERLASEFRVDATVAARDVRAVLADFLADGLIVAPKG